MSEDTWAATDCRRVYEQLKLHNVLDDGDLYDELANPRGIILNDFIMAVMTITNFKREPYTDNDMARMKENVKEQVEDRKALNRAADILQAELGAYGWESHPNMADFAQRWKDAIALLRQPRGLIEHPHTWLRATKHPMHSAIYMATEIMRRVLWALEAHGGELRNKTGLARFTLNTLTFIGINDNDLPSERAVLDALENNLIGPGKY